MEQKTSVDTSSKKLDDSNNSLPQKRAKRQPEEKSPPSHTTSNDAATTAGNLNGANQLPLSVYDVENRQPPTNHTPDFILPSDEDYVRASEENLDPNSAGLASSRTGGAWNKSLEEAHSA